MEIILGILKETWHLLLEMGPYLLLGFGVAGILHIFLSKEKVAQHLAGNDFRSVLKASLLGVPLPLCSCGVIPVAAHLEKQGASKGPVLSFLVSTPTTGADSILATYALLGPLLAIMRPVSALFSGIFTGGLANRLILPEEKPAAAEPQIPVKKEALPVKLKNAMQYAFIDLIEDVAKWLIIGILIGGIISYAIPDELVAQYLGTPWLAYPLMLLIGIPLYVCATGSIPIAASLILKGMSPGAGFIFLFAGPATNTATLAFVGGKMGKKSLAIYLGAILMSGLIFGGLIDIIWQFSGENPELLGGQMEMLPNWLNISSAIILLILLIRPFLVKKNDTLEGKGMLLKISDMNCDHCRKAIDKAVRKVQGVKDVKINLETRQVEIAGQAEDKQIVAAIEAAGYHIAEIQG